MSASASDLTIYVLTDVISTLNKLLEAERKRCEQLEVRNQELVVLIEAWQQEGSRVSEGLGLILARLGVGSESRAAPTGLAAAQPLAESDPPTPPTSSATARPPATTSATAAAVASGASAAADPTAELSSALAMRRSLGRERARRTPRSGTLVTQTTSDEDEINIEAVSDAEIGNAETRVTGVQNV